MSHYYDISRAKQDLGYVPQIGMKEATRRTVAYLKREMQCAARRTQPTSHITKIIP
jgi:hypothetical protein